MARERRRSSSVRERGRAGALALLVAMIVAAPAADAQYQRASQARGEPYLTDTPFGDFPIDRLEPGARLRFTSNDGRRMEARLVAMRDSTLELQSMTGDSLPPKTFAELRALRSVEVRAIPTAVTRRATIETAAVTVVSAALGAVYGAQRDNALTRGKPRKPAARAGRMGLMAGMAGYLGWATGRSIASRRRWRPVTLP
ncbi:MAG TPA: hypothetical protein VHM30_10050 [Gemmatimonadaceae bacterium]|nr:hypothetical protein [Gemmatimonadaceae bacterium]